MLDNHYIPQGYGIMPNLNFGGFVISSYSFFVALGLLTGLLWFYFSITRKKKLDAKNSYFIVLFGLLGGLIGSKILVIIENIFVLIENPAYLKGFIFTGKSIVGGIMGGYLGIRLIKKIKNIQEFRCGNDIAPSVALGMAVGRIGCFLSGCCYGTETSLPIGINFGDGTNRIPTQLIEMTFCIFLFIYLLVRQKNYDQLMPGILFKELVLSYFGFRFVIEFIRDTNKNILFMSIYQVICLLGIAFMMIQIHNEKKSIKINKSSVM